MPTKFEDAIASLKAKNFETPEMLQVLELMGEQNERIKNLEAGKLANQHAITVLDATQHSHGVSIGSLAQDRDTHATRIAEIAGKAGRGQGRSGEARRRRVNPARLHAVEAGAGRNRYDLTPTVAHLHSLLSVDLKDRHLDPSLQSGPELTGILRRVENIHLDRRSISGGHNNTGAAESRALVESDAFGHFAERIGAAHE